MWVNRFLDKEGLLTCFQNLDVNLSKGYYNYSIIFYLTDGHERGITLLMSKSELTFSTLMFAFALVSMNLIPYSSASWRPEKRQNQCKYSSKISKSNKCSQRAIVEYFLYIFLQLLYINHYRVKVVTFSPLSLETCRLSLTSHLFPRTILSTSAEACCGPKFVNMNTGNSERSWFSILYLFAKDKLWKYTKSVTITTDKANNPT